MANNAGCSPKSIKPLHITSNTINPGKAQPPPKPSPKGGSGGGGKGKR